MVGIPPLTLGLPRLSALALGVRQTYVFVVLMAGAIYLLLMILRRAPTGRILAAVRENELRTELLGYDTRWYKLLAFTIGGAIAGLAGAAYAAWGLFINPAVFDLPQAAVVVIWVLVGRYRPTAGAIVYQGRDITRLTTHRRAQHGIGIKLQVPSTFLRLSVEENAWLAAYARCRDTRRATERARQALHEVGLLGRAHDLA